MAISTRMNAPQIVNERQSKDIGDTHPELMKYRYTLADPQSNPGIYSLIIF